MRISFYVSTLGGSPLQVGLHRGLVELGHEVGYNSNACDLMLVFNQCAHDSSYVYPDIAYDGPIAFIDTAEYGTKANGKHSEYWNAFAEGSIYHDTKNVIQQDRLREFLTGRSFPYFIREMWLDHTFPDAYHPIDYPLYALSDQTKLATLDEYVARTVPVACLWGLSNQGRVPISDALRKYPGSDVYVIEQDGPRLPQNEYFRRLEAARCTVSHDGYGSGSFRLTEALVRTVLIMVPLQIRTRAPLIHGKTCLDFTGVESLLHVLGWLKQFPEVAYSIYEEGFDHCHTHYTEKATAQYVLDVVASHDWSKPTWI